MTRSAFLVLMTFAILAVTADAAGPGGAGNANAVRGRHSNVICNGHAVAIGDHLAPVATG